MRLTFIPRRLWTDPHQEVRLQRKRKPAPRRLQADIFDAGETIPIRLFLGGFDLTPTFREVNKKYSTRYYLSLVLIDEGSSHAPVLRALRSVGGSGVLRAASAPRLQQPVAN